MTMPATFGIFQTNSTTKLPPHLWGFSFPTAEIPDLPVTLDNATRFGHAVGLHRWSYTGNDRIGYHTAYLTLEHSDPTKHGFARVLRLMFQDYGATNQVNDRGMPENPFEMPVGESQGLAPYPYERATPAVVDRRFPGAIIDVFHLRTSTGLPTTGSAIKNQLLCSVVVPSVDPGNTKTRWFYQLNGLVVATNAEFVTLENKDGCVAKIIIAALQGSHCMDGACMDGKIRCAYSFRVRGIRTGAALGD